MTANRLTQIRALMKEHGANALFITDQANVRYLTGFAGISLHEIEATCLITLQECWLYAPNMYAEQAKGLQSCKNGSVTLKIPTSTKGLYSLFTDDISEGTPVWVEDHTMTLALFDRLKHLAAVEARPSLVTPLRVIKSAEEIAAIGKAIHLTAKALKDTIDHVKTHWQSLTEQDVALFLIGRAYHYGAEGLGFDPIVASGAGSAQPHYRPTNKRLSPGPLLIDNGFTVDGYTSDITRTYWIGKPTAHQQHIYELVLAVNKHCIAATSPEVTGAALHNISHNMFAAQGVEDAYLHSLGHGYGLMVHESPSVSPREEKLLQEGMTITIEPGLYFAGKFGVRIEDDILITKNGAENLSASIPKELHIL